MLDPTFLFIALPILLITITIHEYAHGKVADIFGDPTARLAGRLTLNPLAHIDPIGFLMLLLVRFGWAKPVPINPYNFRDPRRDSLYVALAGPLSNFLLAWVLAVIFRSLPVASGLLAGILSYAIWINLSLAVFNLIPIPPLDGSHILEYFLTTDQLQAYYRFQQYGFMLLLFVILFGLPLLSEIISLLYRLLVGG